MLNRGGWIHQPWTNFHVIVCWVKRANRVGCFASTKMTKLDLICRIALTQLCACFLCFFLMCCLLPAFPSPSLSVRNSSCVIIVTEIAFVASCSSSLSLIVQLSNVMAPCSRRTLWASFNCECLVSTGDESAGPRAPYMDPLTTTLPAEVSALSFHQSDDL